MAKTALDSWVGRLTKHWKTLVQAAVSVGAVIGTFALPPPVGAEGKEGTDLAFGRFLIALFVGLTFVLSRWYGKKKHAGPWVIAAILLVVSIAFAFVSYRTESDRHVCSCAFAKSTRAFVKGSEYTKEAQLMVDEEPGSCCDVLANFGWNPTVVWTPETLFPARRMLLLLYLLLVIGSGLSILAVVQAIECASKNR